MSSKRKSPRSRSSIVRIDGDSMTLESVEAIATGQRCGLTPSARKRVRAARKVVDTSVREGQRVYGVNTGFGHLSQVQIPNDRLAELQLNLVRSHAAGVGEPFDEKTVRAILALRSNCLSRGHSGLHLETLERMLTMLNEGIHPVVPCQGSVGASGDLAPLAHIALTLIGEGEVFHRGKRLPTARALKTAGLDPLVLGPKEGLALINGTQVMCAVGILALLSAERLVRMADIVGAMTLEALKGTHRAFDRRIHAARPQRGQRDSAANLRRVLRDSPIERSHADCGRVQDCYSLRCIPQVHGAVRDALAYVRRTLEIEVNASTDNPMVFAEQRELLSGGNFHGQPVSMVLDHLATATCSLGTISERRIDRLLNPDLSGLPAFLAEDPGLHSGFMMAHVTAAALVSENKVLAHPASVDSIPTSAGQEDHVSMGVHAARQARMVVDHVRTVLGVELMCAAQALDLHRPLKGGVGVEAARRSVRRVLAPHAGDRILSPDIETLRKFLDSPDLIRSVEKAAGGLR